MENRRLSKDTNFTENLKFKECLGSNSSRFGNLIKKYIKRTEVGIRSSCDFKKRS